MTRRKSRSRRMSIVEEEEVRDNLDREEVSEDERSNTSTSVEPWGNITQDFRQELSALKKLKDRITALDKEFRSKKDPIRSELYTALKRYFKLYPANRFRMFLPDFSEEKFERFLKPRPGLEKLKFWDLKFKIQKILQTLEEDHKDERIFLYSFIGSLNLIHIAKNTKKSTWGTYRLQIETPDAEGLQNMPLKEYVKLIKTKISNAFKDVEVELYNENGTKNQLFYVHAKISEDLVFFGIRQQTVINSKRRKFRRQAKVKPLKETAAMITIVTKPRLPHMFVTGSIPQQERLLELLPKYLCFESTEKQNLIGSDLPSLMQLCKEKVEYPPLDLFEVNFREEEAKMGEIGLSYGNRVAELAKQYEMAAFKGSVDPGNAIEKKGTQTFSLNSKFAKTKFKTVGSRADVDAVILESYKRGYITDLQPFMKMKAEHSNLYICEDDNDTS